MLSVVSSLMKLLTPFYSKTKIQGRPIYMLRLYFAISATFLPFLMASAKFLGGIM